MLQGEQLPLDRCPTCSVARPHMTARQGFATTNHQGKNPRRWVVYSCGSCGSAVLTSGPNVQNAEITGIWPAPRSVADEIPDRARAFLSQAINSINAPSGAVMLAASAVDAMLKDKGFKDGSLSARIKKAAESHLITSEMADWAHDVRLDANDQRHADEQSELPDEASAERVVEFAQALGQFLYVLPARVQRGRKAAGA